MYKEYKAQQLSGFGNNIVFTAGKTTELRWTLYHRHKSKRENLAIAKLSFQINTTLGTNGTNVMIATSKTIALGLILN